MLAVEHLWLDLLEDLLPQGYHLFDEFGPQFRILQLLENLEVFFFLSWPHDRVAISVVEEVRDHTPYPIFLLH